jgi:DNA polymerase-3 subunit gamma/tau
VHQLSGSSFNALLKSVEEPPPHVVFIMATTELHKIPDTILSRAQLYEFRTIAGGAIAAQLRSIADAEGITATDDALALLARYAEGSMRDAQSAFDQVISFAGTTVGVDDVAMVLGLVGRDLLFDILTAVADEDAGALFALAGRAVDAGTDLRIVCRELAALVRAMMLVSIDPSRIEDAEVVFESDRDRVRALVSRFSREDLLRSFDLLAKAEQDVRAASQPRYAFEMTLVRWVHLRKLVPLADLIAGLEKGGLSVSAPSRASSGGSSSGGSHPTFGQRPSFGNRPPTSAPPRSTAGPSAPAAGRTATAAQPDSIAGAKAPAPQAEAPAPHASVAPSGSVWPANFKDRFLAELQRTNRTFFSLHVAQAQRIEVTEGRVVFAFGPIHELMRQQVETKRPWLESVAESIAGRKVSVTTAKAAAAEPDAPRPAQSVTPPPPAPPPADADLKARALADGAVQAMLEVFPAEIREVEEIK